jgi:hypothetical protein
VERIVASGGLLLDSEVVPMPEFAQFVAVTASDESFILPDPQTADIDVTFRNIDLANLDRTRTAVAFFKVSGDGFVRLQMRFNAGNDHFIDFTSTPGVERTWHEVFRGEDLQVVDNELTVSVSQAGVFAGGRIRLSDILVLYHAKTE